MSNTNATPAAPLPRTALTIKEFCQRNGIGRNSVYNEIARGKLKTIRVGRRRLITVQQEAAWLKRCETEA